MLPAQMRVTFLTHVLEILIYIILFYHQQLTWHLKFLSVLSHLQKSKTITAYGMTGSGSTCFGIFKNINEIIKFLEFFNKQDNSNYFIWYGQKKNYNMNRIRTSKTLENIV